MLRLSSFSETIGAVERGRDIAVRAYTLGGCLMRAVEERAQSGARVKVTLEEDPFARDSQQLRRHNAAVAAELRSYGVDVRLEHNVHSKTVTVDGTTFFDESNWRENDVILCRDAQDAANVATLKSEALKEEGAMLESARAAHLSGAIVETETFNRFNVVAKALRAMAADGLSPRLLVDGDALRHNFRELASLTKIAQQGVDVRVCRDTEKFALAGNRAWLGSANASSACPADDMTDWGVLTEDPTIVGAVRDRVEAHWASAHEFKGQVPGVDNDSDHGARRAAIQQSWGRGQPL